MDSRAFLGRAVGLAAGVIADQVFGDPAEHHPVGYFGQAAAWLETHSYADSRIAGGVHTACAIVPLAVLGGAVELAGRRHFWSSVVSTAAATWAVLGGRQLADAGLEMAELLSHENLTSARAQLPKLCGRDASRLDESELARATIESMAENTADAAVASIFWGALAGIPGLLVHRGVNTLDAMIGHRNARYENFGWCAAKLDDALDLLPARITAALAAICAQSSASWQITLRDHADHPSPNGGWCEAAWAGALGVQLGGVNRYYGDRVEERGLLGDGPRPAAEHVKPAAQLVTRVTIAATVVAVGGLLAAAFGRRK